MLFRSGKVGDVAVKQHLAAVLNQYLEPLRQRRSELARRPQDVLDILQTGSQHAASAAQETLDSVHQYMGLSLGQSFNRISTPVEIAPLVGAFC